MSRLKLPRKLDKTIRKHIGAARGEHVVYVDADPGYGPCKFCGKTKELRMGGCYECVVGKT